MMRFNNEYERVSDASFLFFFFFSLELVRPRGVVVVQFGQFQFKYRGFCVSFLSRCRCQLSVSVGRCSQKMKKHERSFTFLVEGRKEALFVLFDPKKLVSGSLFGCFARKRERESGQKTLKSLEERKRC